MQRWPFYPALVKNLAPLSFLLASRRSTWLFALPLSLLVGLSTLACDEESKTQRPAASHHSASQKAPAKSAEATKPQQKEIAGEEEMQAFVQAWLRAQNEGNFDAYRNLYAEKFSGKKLAAHRAREFSRETWLKDRQGMFAKPFSVSAKNVKMAADVQSAMISFTQSWANDVFRDEGDKFLVLVREQGKLKISREEMLNSNTKGEEGVSLEFADVALVKKSLEGYALLIPGNFPLNWAIEHPEYISDNDIQRTVKTEALPPEIRELASKKYELFDAQGRRCQAESGKFIFRLHVVPHFGMVNYWQGREGLHGEGPVASPTQRALDLWQLAWNRNALSQSAVGSGVSLALVLKKNGECGEPIWGREIKEGAKLAYTSSAPSEQQWQQLKAAVLQHPSLPELDQATKSRLGSDDSSWLSEIKRQTARVFTDSLGRSYFYVEATGAEGTCGFDPEGRQRFLFRLQAGQLKAIKGSLSESLRAMVDVNDDGVPELISHEDVSVISGGSIELAIEPLLLNLDCIC